MPHRLRPLDASSVHQQMDHLKGAFLLDADDGTMFFVKFQVGTQIP
jgi:hypothetical protein